MIFRVIRYDSANDFHECRCLVGEGDTRPRRLDLFTDGDLRKAGETKESIVGRTVEVECLSPFIEMATGVKVITKPTVSSCKNCMYCSITDGSCQFPSVCPLRVSRWSLAEHMRIEDGCEDWSPKWRDIRYPPEPKGDDT